MPRIRALVALAFALALSLLAVPLACGAAPERPLKIVTSVEVMQDIISQIGGAKVTVKALVSGGQCSYYYEPTKRDAIAMTWGNAWFGIGMGLDEWCVKVIRESGNKKLASFTVSSGASVLDSVKEHHIWLDPHNAIVIARNIAKSLTQLRPEEGEFFRERLRIFEAEVAKLLADYGKRFASIGSGKLIAYSPAFAYLYGAFGLTVVATIQQSHGQQPSPRDVANALDAAERGKVGVLTADVFDPKSATNLASDGRMRLALLASGEGSMKGIDSYIDLMRKNCEALLTAFKAQS